MADEKKTGTVELSEADYNILKAGYDTLNALWTNKDVSLDFKKLMKKVKPETNIPELDIADRYAKPLEDKIAALEAENKKTREEIETDRKTRKESDDLKDIYAKIDDVAKKRGLTEDGKKGMIEVMQKRQIADPEAAALIYLDTLPKNTPAKSRSVMPGAMNLFGVDDQESEFDAFWKNPVKAQDKVIADILNEGAE